MQNANPLAALECNMAKKISLFISFFNNWMGTGVLGPGGIWGRVQGVGSDHWGTTSQS